MSPRGTQDKAVRTDVAGSMQRLSAEEAGWAQLLLRQEAPSATPAHENLALGAMAERVRGARRVAILRHSGLCGDLDWQGYLCVVDRDTQREQRCCTAVETAAAQNQCPLVN